MGRWKSADRWTEPGPSAKRPDVFLGKRRATPLDRHLRWVRWVFYAALIAWVYSMLPGDQWADMGKGLSEPVIESLRIAACISESDSESSKQDCVKHAEQTDQTNQGDFR